MEKPVRITANEKIRTFNEKVRNGLEHAINFMLASDGPQFQVGVFEPFLMPIETYLTAYKKKSILIKIHAEKAFEGELYWFFELKTAVLLGSLLRMLPASSLAEKLANLQFDELDQDAFGEVGNQLCGILDRAFRTLTAKKLHLRMDFKKKVYPDEVIKLETFVNKEEYVVLLCNISHKELGTQKLTLLLPRTLYEVLLNLDLDLEGVNPKVLLIHSWNRDDMDALQTDLTSRYTKVIPLENAEDVISKADMPNVVAAGVNLRNVSFPLSHNDTIFLKRFVGTRSMQRVPLFFTWECADQAGVDQLKKLGLLTATTSPLNPSFALWVKPFLKAPIGR